MTKQDELNKMMQEYHAYTFKAEEAMVKFALEHNLHLELGDYGSGKTLLLEDHKWSGKQRGEWLHSSETC